MTSAFVCRRNHFSASSQLQPRVALLHPCATLVAGACRPSVSPGRKWPRNRRGVLVGRLAEPLRRYAAHVTKQGRAATRRVVYWRVVVTCVLGLALDEGEAGR